MPSLDLRFRVPSPGLLALPWAQPLGAWDVTQVAFRDIPVGPSRHLVRFVHSDGRLWALKELPRRAALTEYAVLRELEVRALPAVRAAGVATHPDEDRAVLVTRFLEGSWQYRRLLMRVPAGEHAHRARLFDALATLLVDLHRSGIYWGDCSLANTLFRRDGQTISAWLVDAETAEVHPALSDGQRRLDLDVMLENVTGGLLDVAARRGEPPEAFAAVIDEAHGIVERYEDEWALLHERPIVDPADRDRIQDRLARLRDRGFTVDEVRLAGGADDALELHVDVAGRWFHRDEVRRLTGLEVGEGQASILLDDLHAYRRRLADELGQDLPEVAAARLWLDEAFSPRSHRAYAALGGRGDPVQAYCDLLEVRWLLSEQAGEDVGDDPALDALAMRTAPHDSAATMAVVEMATSELAAIDPDAAAHEAEDDLYDVRLPDDS